MATVNSWSASIVNKMKVLFDKGMSTAEIGKRLGFSKNAIVGKINRLGWNQQATKSKDKQSPKKPAQPAVKKTKPVAKKPIAKPAVKAPAKAEARTAERQRTGSEIEKFMNHSAGLMSLRPDQCRWPIGSPDSDNFHFCGEKVFTGKPYCFEHCKLAYQFTAPPKKR